MSALCAVWGMAKTSLALPWHSAFILHRRPLAEHKVILQLLLPELGRLSAVVRPRSGKLRQPLQPFQLLSVQLSGRADLKSIVKLEEQAPGLALHGQALFSALYLNELLCRLWPDNLASDDLFPLYQHSLLQLAQVDPVLPRIEPVLRQFEFALLAELGMPVDWQCDADGQPLQPECYYQWRAEQGWCAAERGWLGELILQLGLGCWEQAGCRQAAKQLSRQLLRPLLGDKPLQSKALFQTKQPNNPGGIASADKP